MVARELLDGVAEVGGATLSMGSRVLCAGVPG